MKNKNLLLGLLAITLVFGMLVVSCDDGSADDDITLTVKNNYKDTIKRVVLTTKEQSSLNVSEWVIIDKLQPSDIIFDTGKDALDIKTDETETFSVNAKGNSKLYIVIVYYTKYADYWSNYATGKELNVSPGGEYTVQLDRISSGWPTIH